MTSIDLKDWLVAHSCEISPNEPLTGRCPSLKVHNPKTRKNIYLNLPLSDSRQMPDDLVTHLCNQLGVEIPTLALNKKANP